MKLLTMMKLFVSVSRWIILGSSETYGHLPTFFWWCIQCDNWLLSFDTGHGWLSVLKKLFNFHLSQSTSNSRPDDLPTKETETIGALITQLLLLVGLCLLFSFLFFLVSDGMQKKSNELIVSFDMVATCSFLMSSFDSISHRFVILLCSCFTVCATIAGPNLHSCSWWAWYATMASITQHFSSTRRWTNGSTSTMQQSKRYVSF